jgi:hypothetical protein
MQNAENKTKQLVDSGRQKFNITSTYAHYRTLSLPSLSPLPIPHKEFREAPT